MEPVRGFFGYVNNEPVFEGNLLSIDVEESVTFGDEVDFVHLMWVLGVGLSRIELQDTELKVGFFEEFLPE